MGNVVRRMFADIDADVYVMVDGAGWHLRGGMRLCVYALSCHYGQFGDVKYRSGKIELSISAGLLHCVWHFFDANSAIPVAR